MFFDKEQLPFRIFGSVYLSQGSAAITHTQRHFDALSFRLRAKGEITTDTQHIPLRRGLIALIPHDIHYTRRTSEDELYAVHLSLLDYQAKEIEAFETHAPERYEALFSSLHRLLNERNGNAMYRAAAVLNEILAAIREEHDAAAQTKAPESKAERMIAPSVQYMEAHFRSPDLKMTDVARQSHLSEVYFRRLFKEVYGLSPQKHLIRLRLRHATALMASGYYSLKEVAIEAGYRDYTYFSAEFRRMHGVPPSEYRYNYTGASDLLL